MKKSSVSEFKLTIEREIHRPCSDIDPFGMSCNIDDCLICRNARVKIERLSDGVIIRNDWEE